MAAHFVSCWSCGNTWEFSAPLARAESCLQCRRDAKCCLNCRFYDKSLNRECSESSAELVKDKEKSNFCDWFEARSAKIADDAGKSMNPLDQLFGSTSTNPKAKSKLEEDFEAFFKKKLSYDPVKKLTSSCQIIGCNH